MEFPRDELLEKYVRLRKEVIDPYVPDLDTANDTLRYVRFNDAWRGLNPYSKFLLPRLTDRKNTFPKVPSKKLAKNANPDNYVTLHYDSDGNLKSARLPKVREAEIVIVYPSDRMSLEYNVEELPGGELSYQLYTIEWYEYDDRGRLVSVEEFQTRGTPSDDVKINCEYYEYEGDLLSHAWCFKDFDKFPMQLTINFVLSHMPDRIYNPDEIEYEFTRVSDGMDYVRNHYFRTSQTITHEGHISEETLKHLADNGFCLADHLDSGE